MSEDQFLGIPNWVMLSCTDVLGVFTHYFSDDPLLPPQSAYVPVGGAECELLRYLEVICDRQRVQIDIE